jgi:photosystem II stability/assembly factor-like uncharacterized protein
MTRLVTIILVSLLIFTPDYAFAQRKKSKGKTPKDQTEKKDTFSLKKIPHGALAFRSIGPAVTSGRIIDIDVNPNDHSEYYVAAAHGSLWKTINGGITFTPIFDTQSSFAMGAVTLEPGNPNVVWVGTGENNAHSNVIPGDGVYKSEDGGKSWTHKGLKKSQHIGGIIVHPNDPNTVWVAAYGPHRTEGGERGIYKTTDGGETWEHVLAISDYTGCWEIHIDPRNPDVLYTVAHQRQRYLYTTISGGDESGIHKSTDGGKTWKRLKGGLPQKKVGRIGMAISPVNPDVLYAVVHAKEGTGTYRSTNRGASWTKQSSYQTSYPFYMQKLFCDTKNVNTLYGMDIFNQVSHDGGKTWKNQGEDKKHVDNHTLWIDPNNNRHMLSGCDGGVYETFDTGKNWDFKANLPLAEIYKVTVDNAKPFYNVYIGTQDNNSLGGPSRTINSGGISNADWYFTLGGDGFESQVDWKDPNIVYSQYQFGNLYRYDKKSGERLYIKAYEVGDTSYRFDWDAALLLSSHDNKRLYHGGNKVLRTDDQGSTWKEFSPDLTRGVPQKMHKLMGQSWSIDDLASKRSMAHVVTIAESPLDENIVYAGSADGLIHFTRDGGKTWTKGSASSLPERARIHHIVASHHNDMVAYAACNDFFAGNFKPFLYKTTDGGKTWTNISLNLPERGSTFTVGEDHVNPDLLFVGTMFGVFVSNTTEPYWVKLNKGIPTATVMDLDIHRGENDLVVSTYGRGVYILDDYSSLRHMTKELSEKEAAIFPIEDGLMFIQADPFGFPGVGFQGASYYTTPNPEVGAVITYYIKDKPKTLKEQRQEEEKKLKKEGKDIKYPDYETLKKENSEKPSFLLFTITDEDGEVVRNIKKPIAKGIQRLVWDFRYSPVSPVSLRAFDSSIPWNSPDLGPMVTPGNYRVALSKYEDGKMTELVAPQAFKCRPLNITSLPPENKKSLAAFNKKVATFSRAVTAANEHKNHLKKLFPYIEKAILSAPVSQPEWFDEFNAIKEDLKAVNEQLNGDGLLSRYEGAARTSLKNKIDLITSSLWSTTSGQTSTYERAYDEAAVGFEEILTALSALESKISKLEDSLEKGEAPYTPGRFPTWKKN